VDIVHQPGREVTADLIVKWMLALFSGACLWLNYPLDSDAHFVFSHLAVVGLLILVPFLVFYRPRMIIRRPWGTTSDFVILTGLLVFIGIRTLQSVGNQFFVGQVSKIILIVIGWICFKSLDPSGRLLRFAAVLLPGVLALGIATGVFIWTVSGKIGAERLRIGPNDYEYVSEYAGLMLPLILFSLDETKQKKQRIFLFAVLTTVLIGLMLTGARGPLLGSVIVILSYGYLARKRLSKAVLIFTISSFVIVFLLLGSIAYTTGAPDDTSRLSFDENSSLENFSSGRWSNWVFLTEEMISDNTWIVFGSGLGRLAEWIPSDGGYYRPAVTNGLLSAWVPFGIIGVFGYLYFNIYLWRRITGMEQSAYRCMAISMYLAYIVTDQFETHWQGTNMLWYVSFVLYLLTLARPPRVSTMVLKRHKVASPTQALAFEGGP
jgi:hypothetical protein